MTQTKAQEFEALDREAADCQGPGVHIRRALWVDENRYIIAAALKTADAFARGESTDDYAGYYSHERDYAAEKLLPTLESVGRVTLFRRGFLEGWKAARRFVIQDP
ncbi:MAG: hypothetical protein WCD38_11760 [Candidatus Tumulicola sp.]